MSLSKSHEAIKVLVFRPEPQLTHTLAELKGLGINAKGYAAIEIKCNKNFMEENINSIKNYDYILLSSSNAVNCAGDALLNMAEKARFLAAGKRTMEAAEEIGLKVSYAPDYGGMAAMVSWLLKNKPGKALVIKSDISESDSSALSNAGFHVVEAVSHYTIIKDFDIDMSDITSFTHMLFFSPSEVKAFEKSASKSGLLKYTCNSKVLCIGKSTYDYALRIFNNVEFSMYNNAKDAIKMILGNNHESK